MLKVITYGTYDMLHYGHINLLKRAKNLGDYLIVGITADDFDKARGKINVKQSLIERIEAVKSTGLVDKIIVEEYEGQKIDDICKYDIDIFTIGSDWSGKFDYLKEYCKVVYLERTQGVSSSKLRTQERNIRFGLVGESQFLNKVVAESKYVNGINIIGIYTKNIHIMPDSLKKLDIITDNFDILLHEVDAVYIRSLPELHYLQIKKALESGKHVLCESPIVLKQEKCKKLFDIAQSNNLILMEAIKTAYSTAFSRLLLLIKSGKIGHVVSVDATCTSLRKCKNFSTEWNGIFEWGPTALLPVFQILGTKYKNYNIVSHFYDIDRKYDSFTKIDFIFDNAVANIKIGDGVKSEGELIISGTDCYVYVPAPWWKMDYFELRYENPLENKRYFYQLDGEGIRYELVAFIRAIESGKIVTSISKEITYEITSIMEDFINRRNMTIIL